MSKKRSPEEKFQELYRLMQENPGLLVVPMVDSEVVCDDGGYWFGSWGSARVDEFYCPKDEHAWFRSDDDIAGWFESKFDYEEEGIPAEMPDEEAEKIMRQKIDALPWKKAIIVYVELPDNWTF